MNNTARKGSGKSWYNWQVKKKKKKRISSFFPSIIHQRIKLFETTHLILTKTNLFFEKLVSFSILISLHLPFSFYLVFLDIQTNLGVFLFPKHALPFRFPYVMATSRLESLHQTHSQHSLAYSQSTAKSS